MTFLLRLTYLLCRDTKTPLYIDMENRKRIYRELDDATKEKISKSSQGKQKSASHRQHISQAMLKYWQGIPNKPKTTSTEEESEDDN